MLQAEIQFGETVSAERIDTGSVQSWLEQCFVQQDEVLSVVVRLVDSEESQVLNRDYRGMDKPTNVLSFPFEVPEGVPIDHLGDLVVCVDVVEREAQEQQKTLADHFAHLVIHGVLHLMGYDHIEDAEAEEMEALEIELLQRIQVANPYRYVE